LKLDLVFIDILHRPKTKPTG